MNSPDKPRKAALAEQWWAGLIALAVLAVGVLLIAYIASPAGAAPVPIAWDADANASAWRVWRGIDLLAETNQASATIDLPADQLSTITVTAHNDSGSSAHSEPLVLLPVTPRHSYDLAKWRPKQTFFIASPATAPEPAARAQPGVKALCPA